MRTQTILYTNINTYTGLFRQSFRRLQIRYTLYPLGRHSLADRITLRVERLTGYRCAGVVVFTEGTTRLVSGNDIWINNCLLYRK